MNCRLWKSLVRIVGCVLMGLGIVMIMTPDLAGLLFATTRAPEASATYIRAIAVREIAIGLWMVIGPSISVVGTTVSIAAISLIPCGDLILVWLAGGGPLSLLPHIVSLVSLLALGAWGSRIA
ncbi:hypothetical protein SB748_26750 [Rhizobium sp. SIMBA_035]